eukprot:7984057-Alexandrium_andersonii.AAC.1
MALLVLVLEALVRLGRWWPRSWRGRCWRWRWRRWWRCWRWSRALNSQLEAKREALRKRWLRRV